MLSGGLTIENLTAAVRITHADLVDVSSGVESAPGIKDAVKIAGFLARARAL
jgi:phosphoribosylanthranilate isomerase